MSTTNKPGDAFVFGLERVPLPCIVTDRNGGILWANPLFSKQISQTEAPLGQNISRFVQTDEKKAAGLFRKKSEKNAPVSVDIAGRPFLAYIRSFGMLLGIVFAPNRTPQTENQDRPSRLPPANNRIFRAFSTLSEALIRPMPEESLILLFIRVFEDLFPDSLLCIKLFDKETMEFEQVYANGRLREESHSHIRITRFSKQASGLDTETAARFLKSANVWITQEYLPVFEDGIAGFDIPLYDGTTIFGLLNFECRRNGELLPTDRAAAAAVAAQMCAAIRNARLIAETTVFKDYLAKVLDQAASPMVVLNRDRTVAVVNQAMELQTGRPRREYWGKDLISFVADSQKNKLATVLLKVMLGEHKSSQALTFPHKGKKAEAEIVFNLAPVLSAEHDVEGVILVGQDLSEIKNLQEQIIHTEKLATLGQVAAGVAHEVGNPLTFIAVYANYLLKKLDGVIEQADIEKIKCIVDASMRIQTFTRELVTYGRPSREKSTLLDVGSLLERALSFCEHLIAQSNVVATLAVETGIKQIYGIRGHLEQVFVNLITNACHAMEGRDGKLEITARMDEEKWIVIETVDTGSGILPEHLDSVFEPFFTTKPEGLGTGLGLSIVRNILTEHNGEVSVQSKPQEGAVFTVKMPAG